jgi:hypothetical protein
MIIPEAAQRVSEILILCEGGLPLFEALELIAEESQAPGLREAHRRVLAGAPLSECLEELPPTLKPLLRHGERTGTLIEMLGEACQWWMFSTDPELPLFYLGLVLESVDLPTALVEGRELFECDDQWREAAKELAQGRSLGVVARGHPRILPPPLDVVLLRAESSQALGATLQAAARGAVQGLLPYEATRDPRQALRQELFSVALMLIAGAPLGEALTVATGPLSSGALGGEGLAGMMERHPEAFPPKAIALVRRAEYAGDLAKTLEFIARRIVGE